MKHLKAKLMASVGMLLVAIILMSTASFAWFTISTNPEVANITASITANGNLEIALGNRFGALPSDSDVGDSGKNQTWGNLIDLNQAFKTSESKNVVTLKPVRVVATGTDKKIAALTYPEYGQDGRIITFTNLKTVRATATDENAAFADVEGVIWYLSGYEDNGDGTANITPSDIYAFSVDYWLRTNATGTDGKVRAKLASSTNRASGTNTTEDGLGSYIEGDLKNNLTILFRASSTDYHEWLIASRTDTIVVDGATRTNIVFRKASYTDHGFIIDPASADETGVQLSTNQACLVTMYVYMDGEKLTNADAFLSLVDVTVNVQFEVDNLPKAMNTAVSEENKRS